MSTPARELSAESWWHILWSNLFGPVGAIVIVWGFYVVAAVFDFDVLAYIKHREPEPGGPNVAIYFWVAIVFSVGAVARAAYTIRRAAHLARHGVEVVATITKVGKLGMKGYVRVYYEYSLNGRRVEQVMSCPKFLAKEYRNGTRQLVLVCDPHRPQRSMARSDVWRDEPSEEEPSG